MQSNSVLNTKVLSLTEMPIGEASKTLFGQIDWAEIVKHGITLSQPQVKKRHIRK